PSSTRRGTKGRARALVAVAVVAAAAVAMVRDPFLDRNCWSDCAGNAFLVHSDPLLARRLGVVVLALAAACGVATAIVGVSGLLRGKAGARRRSGPALAATALAGLALVGYSVALLVD